MSKQINNLPGPQDIRQAAKCIEKFIHKTPLLQSELINQFTEAHIIFKCENFQKAGSFKSRGACNTVFSLSEKTASKGVATHSSGNHAQALARAAKIRGIRSYIVMPDNAPSVKVEAVKGYEGIITFCKPTLQAREDTLKEIIKKTAAVEIHPYNNYKIIAGQATAALETFDEVPDLDYIMAPVGGGGLLSGTALACRYFSPHTNVIATEPEKADDAYQSFNQKKLIPSNNPQTIADGLLTSLGTLTFPIIIDHVQQIVTVTEEAIIESMRIIWERMKIVIEPSAAVPFAAILENKLDHKGKKIGIILSGGNIDLNKLPWI